MRLVLLVGALVVFIGGCSLVVDFDRSLLEEPGLGGQGGDAGSGGAGGDGGQVGSGGVVGGSGGESGAGG